MIRRHTDMNSEAMKQQTKTTKDDQFTMIYNDLHMFAYVCIDRETQQHVSTECFTSKAKHFARPVVQWKESIREATKGAEGNRKTLVKKH